MPFLHSSVFHARISLTPVKLPQMLWLWPWNLNRYLRFLYIILTASVGQVVLCCTWGLNCNPMIFNIKIMHAIVENHSIVLLQHWKGKKYINSCFAILKDEPCTYREFNTTLRLTTIQKKQVIGHFYFLFYQMHGYFHNIGLWGWEGEGGAFKLFRTLNNITGNWKAHL